MIKIFLSYSHDSKEHIVWVEDLAKSLQSIGFLVLLDKWHLGFGQDVNQFMEISIAESDVVFVVCTPQYVDKSNSRRGGVGYESVIISSELSGDQQSQKFIPILRKCLPDVPRLPIFLGNRLYADMSDGNGFGKDYKRLTEQLKKLQANTLVVPSATQAPFSGRMQLNLEGPHWLPNQGEIPANIFELMGVTNQGLINVQLDDFIELFGQNGFWYASATSEESSPRYEYLARHAGLQIEATGVMPYSLRAICIAVSAPEAFTLDDLHTILKHFENLASNTASVMVTSAIQRSGARISLAFQK